MEHEERRQLLQLAFDSANAICKLEGGTLSASSRAIQERVINGEISFDEAVREVLNEALVSSSAKTKESQLRGSVLRYEDPTSPVSVEWKTSD